MHKDSTYSVATILRATISRPKTNDEAHASVECAKRPLRCTCIHSNRFCATWTERGKRETSRKNPFVLLLRFLKTFGYVRRPTDRFIRLTGRYLHLAGIDLAKFARSAFSRTRNSSILDSFSERAFGYESKYKERRHQSSLQQPTGRDRDLMFSSSKQNPLRMQSSLELAYDLSSATP